DKDAVDRQAGERHAGLQSHIGERAFDRAAPTLIDGGGIGHAAGNPEHLTRIGAPGDLQLERAAVEHVLAVELGAIVAREGAPMRERLQSVMRLSIVIARTAAPAYSTT